MLKGKLLPWHHSNKRSFTRTFSMTINLCIGTFCQTFIPISLSIFTTNMVSHSGAFADRSSRRGGIRTYVRIFLLILDIILCQCYLLYPLFPLYHKDIVHDIGHWHYDMQQDTCSSRFVHHLHRLQMVGHLEDICRGSEIDGKQQREM